MNEKQESKEECSEPTCEDLGCFDRFNAVDEKQRPVQNIAEIAKIAIPVDEFYVTEWRERKKSRPSQVHIVMTLGKETQATGVAVSIPLKSKRATNELIKALQRHRDAVWP